MKRFTKMLSAMLAALLCLCCLSGCSALKNKQIDVRELLGMSTDNEEEDPLFIEAEEGGEDVPYPDGFENKAPISDVVVGDTMCIAFNKVSLTGRSTGYFSPSGDTIRVTAAAQTAAPSYHTYKAALWQKTEGGASYVEGCTVAFTADGELYTAKIKGLDPEESYKLVISYDSASYSVTGGMSVEGIANGEDLDGSEEGASA